MNVNWKQTESREYPLRTDENSSPHGVYIRKNIETVEVVDGFTGETYIKYVYQEAFLTNVEYNNYILEKNITNTILQEDDSEAYENYKNKLDTPVEYTNGKMYKPKWAEGVYAGLLTKGSLLPSLFPLKIWDSTELEENAVMMTMQDLITLTLFLGAKQEQYFNEYKLEKAS